jgi:ABC-type uncharacterized transport system permease subunit
MSVPATATGVTPDAVAPPTRRIPRWAMVAALPVVLFLLAVLEQVTGANDLVSSGTIAATFIATTPIMLAGLGGLWSERAGVVNIGLEGMMILGTYGAGYFGYHYGAWAGVLGAVAMGMLGGLLHATQSPKIPDVPAITFQSLSDKLLEIEKDDTFFVSQVAALLRALCTNLSSLVIISFLLLIVTWYVLWRTSFGLRLRSCGESPAAAESLGVHVLRYKFVAVIISGGLAGLAGGVLAMVASSNYRDGQTGGRGYIGLAAMIFGNWRPGGLLVGSGLFGYTETLGLRQGGSSVHALLLAVAVLALALAFVQLRRGGNRLAGVVIGIVGILIGVVYFVIDEVPGDFTRMTPYVITLVVLAFASQRLRMPAADGQVYRKGSAG